MYVYICMYIKYIYIYIYILELSRAYPCTLNGNGLGWELKIVCRAQESAGWVGKTGWFGGAGWADRFSFGIPLVFLCFPLALAWFSLCFPLFFC